jgi:hypothetical protein
VTIDGRNVYDDGDGSTCIIWSEGSVAVGCMDGSMVCGDAITWAAPPDATSELTSCMWFSSTCIPDGWEMCDGDFSDAECPESEDGSSYIIDTASATVSEPAGPLELLLEAYLTLHDLMDVNIVSRSEREITLARTDAGGEAQDTCWPTTTITALWTEGATYSGTAEDVSLTMSEGSTFTSSSVTWTGSFDDTAGTVEDIALDINIDFRELPLGDGLSADELCALAPSFGFSCLTCTDGSDYCLDLRIESMSADGSSIEVVEVADFCE